MKVLYLLSFFFSFFGRAIYWKKHRYNFWAKSFFFLLNNILFMNWFAFEWFKLTQTLRHTHTHEKKGKNKNCFLSVAFFFSYFLRSKNCVALFENIQLFRQISLVKVFYLNWFFPFYFCHVIIRNWLAGWCGDKLTGSDFLYQTTNDFSHIFCFYFWNVRKMI